MISLSVTFSGIPVRKSQRSIEISNFFSEFMQPPFNSKIKSIIKIILRIKYCKNKRSACFHKQTLRRKMLESIFYLFTDLAERSHINIFADSLSGASLLQFSCNIAIRVSAGFKYNFFRSNSFSCDFFHINGNTGKTY